MTDLTIGGETFNVLIEGDEALPILMLSNPLGADLHIWDDQIPDLLKHFRTVRYNPRGHGGSITDAGPYSIKQLGEDALAILDALGIEKTRWLGMSMGGAVGQWLLINAPERIERAVLANTAAHFGTPETWNERIVAAQNHGMKALADSVIERWFGAAFSEKNSERVEEVKQGLLATSPEGYAAAAAALRDLDLRAGLLQIQHQVLVIAGADDQAVSSEQTRLLAETIPGAKLVMLGTRHLSAVEDAAGFSRAAIEFLTKKLPLRQTSTRKAPLPRSIARRPAGQRTPTTRGATTETLTRRRAPTDGTSGKAKAVKVPVVPAKTPRGKGSPAPSTTAPKRSRGKAAATLKTARKANVAVVPASRKTAKAAAAKAVSKSAAPKVASARKTRVAVAPAKATKVVAAKSTSRRAVAKPSTPTRARPTPVKRAAARPAVVAKPKTRATAAKPRTTRHTAVATKAPAKRTAGAAASGRATMKSKGVPKAAAKATASKPPSKPARAKAKGVDKTTKAVKPASKPAPRKIIARAAVKRQAPRRKA